MIKILIDILYISSYFMIQIFGLFGTFMISGIGFYLFTVLAIKNYYKEDKFLENEIDLGGVLQSYFQKLKTINLK